MLHSSYTVGVATMLRNAMVVRIPSICSAMSAVSGLMSIGFRRQLQIHAASCSSIRISPLAKGFSNASSGGMLVSCLGRRKKPADHQRFKRHHQHSQRASSTDNDSVHWPRGSGQDLSFLWLMVTLNRLNEHQ